MIRRAPLALRVTVECLGRTPPNAIRFEPGTRVGVHTIVRRTGTWGGCAQWLLRCPVGYEFTRKSYEIQQTLRGRKGPMLCRECRAAGRRSD